ncbi:MAG TPA: hypothetical protein VFE42_34885 [Chloroflexota bacterium]|nr:hypothetical protein [Chloroflexota bacterium]
MSQMPQIKTMPQPAGTPSDAVTPGRPRGGGWLLFAAIMLVMSGVFNVIDGLAALANSRFYVAGAVVIWSDLRTWGWITLALGIITILAGVAVMNRQSWGRWFGIVAAGLSALGQMIFMSAYPWWSLLVIGLDILVIYGLSTHWQREISEA